MDLDEALYKTPASKYGAEYQNHLLEQYKLYVQMADKISERRAVRQQLLPHRQHGPDRLPRARGQPGRER
jgi:hypothetical protein